ncbi:hypothetical protein HI972_004745 [Salmonella enterica]|nr:hypothetical protein [Salmonella enterica]EGG6885619.1 hypothetical protein [Salmonella enterica]
MFTFSMKNEMLPARQGKARQGKARQGKARQGKARQGKAIIPSVWHFHDASFLFPLFLYTAGRLNRFR